MSSKWALILGASSGFGAATSIELARHGYGIFGVHFDLRSTLPSAVAVQDAVKAAGQDAVFFNINAADEAKRRTALDAVRETLGADGHVRVLMHSLAFGTLLPFIGDNPKERISQKQMDMTLDVMAHSLVYWAQDMADRRLLAKDSRIFAMTSSGSTRVIKAYGAVSAAKACAGVAHPAACIRTGADGRDRQRHPRRRHRHTSAAAHPRRTGAARPRDGHEPERPLDDAGGRREGDRGAVRRKPVLDERATSSASTAAKSCRPRRRASSPRLRA